MPKKIKRKKGKQSTLLKRLCRSLTVLIIRNNSPMDNAILDIRH